MHASATTGSWCPRRRAATLGAFLLWMVAGSAWGWETEGLRVRGRIQTRWELLDQASRYQDRTGWTSFLNLERIRLDLRWDPSQLLRLVFEADFADGFDAAGEDDVGYVIKDMLKDVYLRLRVSRKFMLQAGHFKKPFSRLRLLSPWKLPFPERGMLDRLVINRTRLGEVAGEDDQAGGFGGRDLGVMVSGRFRKMAALSYALGAFFPPGYLDARLKAHRDIVGRLAVEPFEGLSLAVDAAVKNFVQGDDSLWTYLVGADAELRLAGLILMLEAAYGDNPVLLKDASAYRLGGGKTLGVFATVSYEFDLGGDLRLTPAVQLEFLDPSDLVAGNGYRLAGAVYFRFAPGVRAGLFGETVFGDPRTVTYGLDSTTPSASSLLYPTRFGLQLEAAF
jgi:hypothetical protein